MTESLRYLILDQGLFPVEIRGDGDIAVPD